MEEQEVPLAQSATPQPERRGNRLSYKAIFFLLVAVCLYSSFNPWSQTNLVGDFRYAFAGKNPSLATSCLNTLNDNSQLIPLPDDVNMTDVCRDYNPPWLRRIKHDGNIPTIEMIAMMNGLKTFATFLAFGEELKFEAPAPPQDGCFSKAKNLGKASAKVVAGVCFLALAVNAYIVDFIHMFTAMRTLGDKDPLTSSLTGLIAFIQIWILSPNLPAAMAIWSKLAFQSPAAALNLTPRYEAFSGAMAFPKYPCDVTWLSFLQHVYAVILLPYIVVNVALYPLILPFVMIWLVVSKSVVPRIVNIGQCLWHILTLGLVLVFVVVSCGLLMFWPWFFQQVIHIPDTFLQAVKYEALAIWFPLRIFITWLILFIWSSLFAISYAKFIGATLDDFFETTSKISFRGIPFPRIQRNPFTVRWSIKEVSMIPDAIELEPSF